MIILMIASDLPPEQLLANLPQGHTYVANLDPHQPQTWQGQLVKLLYAAACDVPAAIRSVVSEPGDAEAQS